MPGSTDDPYEDRIRELLEEALALEPEERPAFLDAVCPDNPTLRAEVERRIRAHEAVDEVAEYLDEIHRELLGPEESAGTGFEPGDEIDHFVLQEEIGRGGMGVVYRARDVRLQRDVALKFLPPALARDEESKRRFLREARTASSLDHPHVGTVHEAGATARGDLFIAMAYYPGPSLAEVIERGPVPVSLALEYARQIARALSAAHAASIVHRDVKPSNVLLPEDGLLKVVDFGLARWTHRTKITRSGEILGTTSYMSPEQIRGHEVDERTDLWSLGAVLHEMLSGSRPFEEEYEAALLYAILNQDPPQLGELRPEVPDPLSDVVDRALRKDPDERYQTADQLMADLHRIEQELEPSPAPEGAVRGFKDTGEGPITRPHQLSSGSLSYVRRSRIYFGLGVLLLGVLGAWYFFLSRTAHTAAHTTRLRIAVLPLSEEASYRRSPVLSGLGVTLTHLLSRMDEQTAADLSIVPASEMEGIASVGEARARLVPPPDYILTLSHRTNAEPASLSMALVATDGLDQQRTVDLALRTDGEGLDHNRLIEELDELLALDLSASAHRTLAWETDVPPKARDQYDRGRRMLERAEDTEDLRAATRFFRWAVRTDSTFPEAHAGLANAYWQIYERTGANRAAERAARHEKRARTDETGRPSIHVQNGLLNVLTGSYRQAVLDFKTALAQDSSLAEAYLGLGRAYEGLHRYSDAEAAYERAVTLRADEPSGYRYLGTYYFRRGDHDRAAEAFRSAIRANPEAARNHVNLGVARYYQGRVEEARSAFERALSLKGLDARNRYVTLSNLGTIYYYARQYDRARDAYIRALRIDSTDHRVWSYLGSARSILGAPEEKIQKAFREAARRAERALEVNPRQPMVRCQLASYRFELGDRDAARRLLEQALSEAPKHPEILYLSGHLFERLGDRDRALRYLSSAVANGFPVSQIEEDPELEALRSDPRYPDVLRPDQIEELEVTAPTP